MAVLHNLYICVISKEDQAEAEYTCGAEEGASSARGELRKNGIRSDEQDEVVNGHFQLLASPQVVDE